LEVGRDAWRRSDDDVCVCGSRGAKGMTHVLSKNIYEKAAVKFR
jgi:hypothetical protein